MRAFFPPPHITVEKGHGRIEERRVQTSAALNDYVNFPHVGQVFRVERTTTVLRRDGSEKRRHEVVYGVTSLRPDQADARRVGELVRGQWEIENRIHWVRDVTFDEDRSQIRTGSAPQVFACLRNFAINCLRVAKCSNIASGLRHLGRNWVRVFRLLGI